eukprot:gene22433-29545_t
MLNVQSHASAACWNLDSLRARLSSRLTGCQPVKDRLARALRLSGDEGAGFPYTQCNSDTETLSPYGLHLESSQRGSGTNTFCYIMKVGPLSACGDGECCNMDVDSIALEINSECMSSVVNVVVDGLQHPAFHVDSSPESDGAAILFLTQLALEPANSSGVQICISLVSSCTSGKNTVCGKDRCQHSLMNGAKGCCPVGETASLIVANAEALPDAYDALDTAAAVGGEGCAISVTSRGSTDGFSSLDHACLALISLVEDTFVSMSMQFEEIFECTSVDSVAVVVTSVPKRLKDATAFMSSFNSNEAAVAAFGYMGSGCSSSWGAVSTCDIELKGPITFTTTPCTDGEDINFAATGARPPPPSAGTPNPPPPSAGSSEAPWWAKPPPPSAGTPEAPWWARPLPPAGTFDTKCQVPTDGDPRVDGFCRSKPSTSIKLKRAVHCAAIAQTQGALMASVTPRNAADNNQLMFNLQDVNIVQDWECMFDSPRAIIMSGVLAGPQDDLKFQENFNSTAKADNVITIGCSVIVEIHKFTVYDYTNFSCEHLVQFVTASYLEGIQPIVPFYCSFFSNNYILIKGSLANIVDNALFYSRFAQPFYAEIAGIVFDLKCKDSYFSGSTCIPGDVWWQDMYCKGTPPPQVHSPPLFPVFPPYSPYQPLDLPLPPYAPPPPQVKQFPFCRCDSNLLHSPWRLKLTTREPDYYNPVTDMGGERVCFSAYVDPIAAGMCNQEFSNCCTMDMNKIQIYTGTSN